MDNELEKAFEDKFYCPARFAQEIEGLVQAQEEMNYIDAIVYFCEELIVFRTEEEDEDDDDDGDVLLTGR